MGLNNNVIRIYGGCPSRFSTTTIGGSLPKGLLHALDTFADDLSADLGITLSRAQTISLLLKEALYAHGIDVILNTRAKKRTKKKVQTLDSTYADEFDD
jgi:hypothetical protein